MKLLFGLVCFSFSYCLFAQSKTASIYIKNSDLHSLHTSFYQGSITTPIDTSLEFFDKKYELLNSFRLDLGNLGSPYEPINDFRLNPIGFINFNRLYEQFIFNSNFGNFELSAPLSRLEYINGTNNEEGFAAFHSQNVCENWNVSAGFNSISSSGFMQNGRNSHNSFYVGQRFKSQNGRLTNQSRFTYGVSKRRINNGLSNELDFLNQNIGFSNPLALNVNSDSASSRMFSTYFESRSMYKLGVLDTGFLESTIYAVHELTLDQSYYRFDDEGPDSIYYSILTGRDFLGDFVQSGQQFKKVSNFLGFAMPKDTLESRFSGAVLGLRLDYLEWGSILQNQSTLNAFLEAKAGIKVRDWNLKSEFTFGLAGISAADFDLKVFANKLILKKSQTYFRPYFCSNLVESDLFLQSFSTDAIAWNNDFQKQNSVSFGGVLDFTKNKFDLGFELNNFNNLVVLNPNYLPEQISNNVQVLRVNLNKKFDLGRIHTSHQLVYQEVLGAQVIPLPQFIAINDIYLEGYLFNNVLQTRIGVDVMYYSAFYSNNFSGMLNSFYLQNNSVYGSYPFASAYANFKLKTGRIFVRLTHPHAGLIGYDYMIRPGYFYQEFMLRFGFNWIIRN